MNLPASTNGVKHGCRKGYASSHYNERVKLKDVFSSCGMCVNDVKPKTIICNGTSGQSMLAIKKLSL